MSSIQHSSCATVSTAETAVRSRRSVALLKPKAYLRKLLVVGAHSVLHHRERHNDPLRNWAKALLAAKPFKLVAVAIANKMARIVFALLSSQSAYAAPVAAA